MSETGLLIFVLITLGIVAFFLPQYFLRKAGFEVVKILREHGAVDEDHGVFAKDVGLEQQSIFERALKRRDYKPKALEGFIYLGIVGVGDDGRVFLRPEELQKSVWRDG